MVLNADGNVGSNIFHLHDTNHASLRVKQGIDTESSLALSKKPAAVAAVTLLPTEPISEVPLPSSLTLITQTLFF